MQRILISVTYGGGVEPSEAQEAAAKAAGLIDDDGWVIIDDAFRTNPQILECELQSGQAICEVPDGAHWKVLDYDGSESVIWSMEQMTYANVTSRGTKTRPW